MLTNISTQCALSGALTEKAEQLDPDDLFVRAEALVVVLIAEVSEVVQLEQVNDCYVDKLLGTEGFLENQSL